MNIDGKRAIVLGGTSGIGLAAACGLKDRGAVVTVMGRSEKNLATAREVLGDTVGVQAQDVLDRTSLGTAFAELGPIDILVNAATGGPRATGPFEKMDLDGFQGSFAKLWGYVNSVHAVIPHLTDDGCIVLVSGSPARKCAPGMSAISTVGNAVEGFCRAIATEIAPKRINVVSPGIIDTPMFPMEGEARENFLTQATAKHLLRRAGTADEVASGILFAISNSFVTGSVIDVDGGALLP